MIAPPPAELAHRLLFQALVEIRAEGYAQSNTLVFRFADLFHTAAFDMLAAEGEFGYDEVLRQLAKKVDETGCGRWLESAKGRVESSEAAAAPLPSKVLGEAALAADWARPEEDAAWAHLQPGK